jgi:alkyl hydroperoxide reductase subunit AhpC
MAKGRALILLSNDSNFRRKQWRRQKTQTQKITQPPMGL